jgi:cbb3-type cytochrome oxidase maturation protein
MESLYILVPISLVFVFLIGWLFWRALASGQFDDLERPGFEILNDDDRGRTPVDKSAAVVDRPKSDKDVSAGV